MTADKARRILEQKPIDLAILDIHLNNNPHDLSGLELAVDTDRSIPKLIITAEPTWETTRRALKIPRGGSSPAVDFLAKSEKDIYHKIVQAVRIAVPVRVFIVHGHDDGAKLAVSQFVRDLGLLPIILHDHPWGGRTIIENFENRSRVGFAIALLTPDDVGGISQQELRPRARQNVIFELGYFIGRLGRGRVAVLHKEDTAEGEIEFPSDYDGVHYIPMDEREGWKIPLAKEIKRAGIDINLNTTLTS